MDDNLQLQENNSLETPDSAQSQVTTEPATPPTADSAGNSSTLASPDTPTKIEEKKDTQDSPIRRLAKRLNVYNILLVLILFIIFGATYYAIQQNRQSAKETALNPQNLSIDDLKKLSNTDAKIGDASQTLNIASNAIFAGKVLVKDSVDIAGSLKVGGTLSLAGVNVGGTSTLEQVQSKSLAISGDATIQGKMNLQGNLIVNGNTSFSGSVSAPQITVDTLQLNKDLVISRHVTTQGTAPTRSNGSALGSGGTSTINGTDTSGTITINTGSSAPAGCFISVTFATSFSAAPHVIVSPVGSVSGGLDYYVNKTNTGFSLCTANDPPDSASGIIFDYIVIG